MIERSDEISVVTQTRHGPVLVLSLTNEALDAPGLPALDALTQALDLAMSAPETGAIVLAIAGHKGGPEAGLAGLARAVAQSAQWGRLCLRLEDSSKPVVALLQDGVLGLGAEIALSAHVRVAPGAASFGLPHVRLGLVPGAGGTQRLPRLITADHALAMLVEGAQISAAQGLAIGLMDLVVEDQALEAALLAAGELIGKDWSRLRTSARALRDPAGHGAAVAAWRRKSGGLAACDKAMDCVEAALLLPFAQGLSFENAAFEDLLDSATSKSLRHAVLAEEIAFAAPERMAAPEPMPLDGIAIWGAGGAAADLALQALTAGLGVTLVEANRATLVAALEHIAAGQEAAVRAGRITSAARDADWARLKPMMAPEGLLGADLVFRVPEAGAVPGLATGLPVIVLGASDPPDGVGLQAGPAAGQLAELSAWPDALPEVQRLGVVFARRLGWRVVFAGADGQIERRLLEALAAAIAYHEGQGVAHRLIAGALAAFGIGTETQAGLPPLPEGGGEIIASCLAALANQGAQMLWEGVALRPADVDAVATASGLFPRWHGGPMYWADQRGALVLRADLRLRAAGAPEVFTPAPLFDELIANGQRFADLNAAPRAASPE